MKSRDFENLQGTLQLDALLWKRLGHPLSKLHLLMGRLYVEEQYANSLGCNSLECFEHTFVPHAGQWAIAWNPRTDSSIWSALLVRMEQRLKSVVGKIQSYDDLPTRVVKAAVQRLGT